MPITAAVALATEGSANVATVVEEVFTIATKALTMVTGNPILLLFFAAPIVGIGIGVIKKLK